MNNLDTRITDLPPSIYNIISRIDELNRRIQEDGPVTTHHTCVPQNLEQPVSGIEPTDSSGVLLPQQETVYADNV